MYLPPLATWLMSTPISVAIWPRTVNMTVPAKMLVRKSIILMTIASLKFTNYSYTKKTDKFAHTDSKNLKYTNIYENKFVKKKIN